MTQREKSQSIGVLMIVVFSAMLLWALTAVAWPVPVVYADDPEIIAITVTSNRETYFYNTGLDPTGGEVYFNSVGGEGAGQVLTVTVTCSGMVNSFEGTPAFGDNPPPDTIAPWQVIYTVEAGAGTQSGIVFTVTNAMSETDMAVINFTQDNVDPTVELTNVTNPGYDYDLDWGEPPDELDTDGSNWYSIGDFPGGKWIFTSTTGDDGAGRASCAALWDHSNDIYDQTKGCTLDGDGSFSGVNNDDDGTVTVAVIVTDKVGNATSDSVVFKIDNTEPTITSLYISENSDYLYRADDLITIHYGDEMPEDPVQTFTVNGSSNDTGVGLDRAEFSSAFGSTPDPDPTPGTWSGRYYPDNQNWGDGIITVTVTDLLGNAAYQTFNYFRDAEPPAVVVKCPAIISEPSWIVGWRDSYDPPPDASGLKHFNVQYKVESGDWQGWLAETSEIEATFGPTSPVTMKDGETYYFQVEAVDNVSNVQYGECETTYLTGVKKVFLATIMKSFCPDTSPCDWDIHEPNNFMCSAYPISSSVCVLSYICSPLDRSDYYFIEITTPNAINIELTSLPANTDYDLYLYDSPPLYKFITRSAKGEQTPETITYHPTHTGIYYVRVYPYSGYSDIDSYELCVSFD
jgi:hypothetical protein